MDSETIKVMNQCEPKLTLEIERIHDTIRADNERSELASLQGKHLPLPETTDKEMSIVLNWYADRLENWAKSLNEMIKSNPQENRMDEV